MIRDSHNVNKKKHIDINENVIGFAGLTHLGLNSAVASASRGFQVVGYDHSSTLVKQINENNLNVIEPGLPELLSKYKKNISFSADLEILTNCDIVYISTDVPTDDQGKSDLSPIYNMINIVTSVMSSKALLVILCQVPPGFTRKVKWPLKQLYYQVETLVFGRAVERARYPERYILGCADPNQMVNEKLYNYLKAFDCPVLPMRYESAELAKISINMCLVAMISAANTLAEICENIGADWSEIIPALRLDKRIGQHSYLMPGLGISGGNLERDMSTILQYAKQYKTDGGVVSSWIYNSRHRKEWAWKIFKNLNFNKKLPLKVGVLGLTYKEDTNSIKNSPSLIFLNHLKNHDVGVYDPAVADMDIPTYVHSKKNILDTVKGVDVLAIMTAWSEFKDISVDFIVQNMRGRVIIDPYRVLDCNQVKAAGFDYFSLGINTHTKSKQETF